MGVDGALDVGLIAHARADAAGGDGFGLIERPLSRVLVETLREGRGPRAGVADDRELGLDLLPAIRVLPGLFVLRLGTLLGAVAPIDGVATARAAMTAHVM